MSAALTPLSERLAPATLLAEVQRAWTGAVGEVIAAEATPVSEHDGILNVSCSAAVWAQELELMSADVLAALNANLTRGRVSGLRCRSEGR